MDSVARCGWYIDCKVEMDSDVRYGWYRLQGRDGFSNQVWVVLIARQRWIQLPGMGGIDCKQRWIQLSGMGGIDCKKRWIQLPGMDGIDCMVEMDSVARYGWY